MRWLPWGHGSSGGESAPAQEGRKFALIGVGMAAWPPGPHAPHPGRVQEPGLGVQPRGWVWGGCLPGLCGWGLGLQDTVPL